MSVWHEEGVHRVKIEKATLSMSKTANKETGKFTDQVILELDVIGKYEGEELHPVKKGRFNPNIYLSVTENTMGTESNPGWVADVLKALGFDGDFNKIEQLQGWEGDAYCGYEPTQDGKGQRERWSINTNTVRTYKVPEAKTVRSLASKFSKLFKGNSRKPTEPVAVSVASGTDDEIPF